MRRCRGEMITCTEPYIYIYIVQRRLINHSIQLTVPTYTLLPPNRLSIQKWLSVVSNARRWRTERQIQEKIYGISVQVLGALDYRSKLCNAVILFYGTLLMLYVAIIAIYSYTARLCLSVPLRLHQPIWSSWPSSKPFVVLMCRQHNRVTWQNRWNYRFVYTGTQTSTRTTTSRKYTRYG